MHRSDATSADGFGLWVPLVLLAVAALAGCESYRLRGAVVAGEAPGVLVVKPSDVRLREVGLPGATIELVLDPASMSPKPAGAALSDARGRFDVPIKEMGAGLLEYELSILCRLKDHGPVYQTIALPGSDRRLLIVLAPGRDAPRPNEDLISETLRLGGQPDPRQ